MIKYLVALFLCLSTSPNYAQELQHLDAPFGLQWGVSAQTLRDSGLELKDTPFKDFGRSFIANKLPKIISDADTILLAFGNDDELWRIVAISKTFGNDPYGTAVKARYQELVQTLDEKYGRGTPHQYVDHQLWKSPSEFVMGIKSGRSSWYTVYENSSVSITLGIIASSMDEAAWRLSYSNKRLQQQFEASKKEKEKGAL